MATPEKLLLVEGKTDEHVVHNIRAKLSPSIPEFSISAKDGINPLLGAIYEAVQNEERTVLGIMLDANEHPDRRRQAVADKLRETGIELPGPSPAGVVIPSDPVTGLPRVGVWMMPDNQSPGELENFLSEMIPAGDPVWPLAKGYIDGIPPEHRKFKDKHLQAQVHAWLAAQEEPRPPGLAIKTQDLDIDGPLCVLFTEWLRDLFGEPTS